MAQLSVVSPHDEALALARSLPAPGPATSRFWKIDVAKLGLEDLTPGSAEPHFAIDPSAQRRGVIACDVRSAERALLDAQGSVVDWRRGKLTALNAAHRNGGAVIYLPAGVVIDEPIVLRHHLSGEAAFPYTLVVASPGARATIVSRCVAGDEVSLVSEIVEIVASEHAQITFAAIQDLRPNVRVFWTRGANVARDAELGWAIAELGAELSIGQVRSTTLGPGARTTLAGFFFPTGRQHVDVASEADHPAGQTQSETLFKSAATGSGQARFIGNIRIHPAAHGVDATLRDDALLLSKNAHIDSIPALEIAANDVKAYHGATIGAIDEDELFYAMTRGIDRHEAERMIALGFFEPAIVRFPTEGLRYELRAALAEKIA
ncbi:MAG: Fe-S cluster assembly protein SufD [Candidatus Eremiobacteraeota bacterium]|nr:Fe-S cluster assembly protein SufD [Candidatus Eremiobacteraeota bacterium]